MKLHIGDKVKHINHPQFGVGVVVNEGITGVEVEWEGSDKTTYHLFQHLNRYFDSVSEALGEKTVQQKHPSEFTDQYYNTPEKKPETRKFWAICSSVPYVEGAPDLISVISVTVKFETSGEAQREAERLSKKYKGVYYHVLECTDTVVTENNPTTRWYNLD